MDDFEIELVSKRGLSVIGVANDAESALRPRPDRRNDHEHRPEGSLRTRSKHLSGRHQGVRRRNGGRQPHPPPLPRRPYGRSHAAASHRSYSNPARDRDPLRTDAAADHPRVTARRFLSPPTVAHAESLLQWISAAAVIVALGAPGGAADLLPPSTPRHLPHAPQVQPRGAATDLPSGERADGSIVAWGANSTFMQMSVAVPTDPSGVIGGTQFDPAYQLSPNWLSGRRGGR
jgi:hypothetical protein